MRWLWGLLSWPMRRQDDFPMTPALRLGLGKWNSRGLHQRDPADHGGGVDALSID